MVLWVLCFKPQHVVSSITHSKAGTFSCHNYVKKRHAVGLFASDVPDKIRTGGNHTNISKSNQPYHAPRNRPNFVFVFADLLVSSLFRLCFVFGVFVLAHFRFRRTFVSVHSH